MADSAHNDKIIIAIYGGGVTGATLAQALKDHNQLILQYFDPKPDFTTITDPFLSFHPGTHAALSAVSKEAGGAIAKVGWTPEEPSLTVVGQGSAAGSTVCDYARLSHTSTWPELVVVQPSSFLKEMLSTINSDNLHSNKKLVSVTQTARDKQPLDIAFEDGSTYQVDVLIGDDGPMGIMRSLILGPEHPATKPVFEHYLTAVGNIPREEDMAVYLGPRYGAGDAGRRFEHIGDNAWILNENRMRSVLGTFYTSESYDVSLPLRPTTPEELQARFGDFEYGKGMASALAKFSDGWLIPEIAHKHAPTYVNGLMAIAGNSAHKMSNFQQLHHGQHVEDGMILGAVLKEAKNIHGLAAALYAYDAVQRPRSQWVSDHANAIGKLWHGRTDEVGLDVGKLRGRLEQWWKEWESFDVLAHREEAVRVMKERLWAAGYTDERC